MIDFGAPAAANGAAAPKGPRTLAPSEVVQAWRAHGPLVHEPTCIRRLDELVGGGFVYGSRVYIAGAPDAGKTGLLVQLGDLWQRAGVEVGIVASDEEPDDIVTRLAQRNGWLRQDCEAREAEALDALTERLADTRIRIYEATTTIEAAAEDLAARAQRGRAALLLDSVQTVLSDAALGMRDALPRLVVAASVAAIRKVAIAHRLLVVATSEMSRAAYRSRDSSENVVDLAAAKESGAIEYGARVLLAMRSVAGSPDLVALSIAKNKHGPSGETIYLRIDRRHMTLTETDAPEADGTGDGERDRAAALRVTDDAARVASILRDAPGITVRDLQARAQATGMGHDRVYAGLARIGRALVRDPGKRGAIHMSVDLAALDAELATRLRPPGRLS